MRLLKILLAAAVVMTSVGGDCDGANTWICCLDDTGRIYYELDPDVEGDGDIPPACTEGGVQLGDAQTGIAAGASASGGGPTDAHRAQCRALADDLQNGTAACPVPLSQALDGNNQASLAFSVPDRSCSTAAGYTGSEVTLDAPSDGSGGGPGFSTENGWTIASTSAGTLNPDQNTYVPGIGFGDRVTAQLQHPEHGTVTVEFTLSNPVIIHSVQWPQ